MAKMLMPETDHRHETFDPKETGDIEKPVNIFDAIGSGAATGLTLALNVGAMLLAFVAMIGLVNGLLSGVGGWFGADDITLQGILGMLFAPVAFLVGVPWDEALQAGSLIGQKIVVTEFYAYLSFVEIKDAMSAHTQVIVTFALCGFANLSSIAILLGGLGSIVPSRRRDVARLGLRAVLGGTLANLMSASLAGLFFSLQ
jgi:CNT family concentrative nucleoside transporter